MNNVFNLFNKDEIMKKLISKGYSPDRSGIIRFQREHGVMQTGLLTPTTIFLLFNSSY